uniref:Uncharacterized protein n=1 Tax=Pristionchus pacificus TaxID=54126 RepID=A0A2A6BNV4_PRIPA|eukprot:PDM67441.1 hypothetical protein PRIPAC_48858 [Pristionchus pacificus]
MYPGPPMPIIPGGGGPARTPLCRRSFFWRAARFSRSVFGFTSTCESRTMKIDQWIYLFRRV